MKKKILHLMIALLFISISLWACSSDTEGESEKGAIKEMTDQVAKDIVHHIRSPINKAHAVKEREEERQNDWEDTAEESSRVD